MKVRGEEEEEEKDTVEFTVNTKVGGERGEKWSRVGVGRGRKKLPRVGMGGMEEGRDGVVGRKGGW